MEVEKRFIRNYLSKTKYQTGKLSAFFILTLCLIASLFYWDQSFAFSHLLSASKTNVFEQNEFWRLFTTSFIHGDIEHLLANSLMLFILTYFVTAFFGAGISILLSFIMGIGINYIVISQYAQDTTLVGASGVIFYLWGFWLIQYVFINTHMSLFSRLVRVGGIFLILLVPTSYDPATSYLAHYIGFAIGLVIGSIYFAIKRNYIRSFEFWEYRYIPNLEEQDREVDELLANYSADSSRL